MTDRPRADRSALGGWHFQMSKLLASAVIAAVAATGALIVLVLTDMPAAGPPPAPGTGPGPNGMPPPPEIRPLAVFSIVTGFFVLTWLAVLVVYARDQVLRHIRQQQDTALGGQLAALRAELAADRERELKELSERFTELTVEYGERRETDGYLNGMRTATMNDPPENVRSIRRTPPPR